MLELEDVWAPGDRGEDAVRGVSLVVRAGEIVGRRRRCGQRPARARRDDRRACARASRGTITRRRQGGRGPATRARRSNAGIAFVPEDRLATGAAPGLSIASNLVLRSYREPPARAGRCCMLGRIRERAVELIQRYQHRGARARRPRRACSRAGTCRRS